MNNFFFAFYNLQFINRRNHFYVFNFFPLEKFLIPSVNKGIEV